MPIDRYQAEDPFDNHPLFKTEEQARIEETMDGSLDRPVAPVPTQRSRSRWRSGCGWMDAISPMCSTPGFRPLPG